MKIDKALEAFNEASEALDHETQVKAIMGAKALMRLAGEAVADRQSWPDLAPSDSLKALGAYLEIAAQLRAEALALGPDSMSVVIDIADDQAAISRTGRALAEFEAVGKIGRERREKVNAALDGALAVAIRLGPAILAGLAL